jgi:hypothetical protein
MHRKEDRMKTTKRTIRLLAGSALAAAMMLPVAASAHTQVFLGINPGGQFAPPQVEVYSAPAYYPPSQVYYSRPAYYAPRVVYGEPQVIYYHHWHRNWDHDQRGDWRRGWDQRGDWRRGGDQRDDHDRHYHWHHGDDDDQ